MPTNRRLNLFQQLPRSIGRLDQSIAVQLRRVDLYTSEAFEVATEEEGLPRGVISSLALIVANPGICQKEISKTTGIDKSGLVAIIDYLEQHEWIERHRSHEDRRRYALRSTAAGEQRLDALVDKVAAFEKAMLASLSERELATFKKLMDRVLESCRQWGAPIIQLRAPKRDDGETPEALRKAS